MSRRRALRRTTRVLWVLALALAPTWAQAADAPADAKGRAAPPPPLASPPTIVEVPADEVEVLLRLQKEAVLLRYEDYRRLLEEARARRALAPVLPPVEAVRLSGEGTLDLSDEQAARFRIVYRVQGLAEGPRTLGFASGGAAFESVTIEPEGDAGPARYEEVDGVGRLHLEGPGIRRVTVVGSAVPTRAGVERALTLWLPNPAAMALVVTLPRGARVSLAGEGPLVEVTSPPERPLTVTTRPTREGQLAITWVPATQGTEGPSVLDAQVTSLYTLGGGVVGLRALARVEVLRTPLASIALEVPADLAVHAVEGPHVTTTQRSEDRRRLTVSFEQPVLGPLEVLLQGERPVTSGPKTELPRLRVEGALRHRGEAALVLGRDVSARDVRVEGGRRISTPAIPTPPGAAAPAGEAPLDPKTAGVLRYALYRGDTSITVDLEPVALRVDATSTYYLNLAEPGHTLIATMTYRVVEGRLFRLRPRFPAGFDLRTLTLNGAATGFARDLAGDGVVEIALPQGVGPGGEVLLLATLERARADWLPEREHVAVDFVAPRAGADREEGYVAVGADAGFEVLDAGTTELVPVGAADLTARGLSSAGLLYGYRLDGAAPRLALDVVRREPLLEAEVVTILEPGPRRADLAARAIHRIRRAGVRRLFLDLPSSAGEQVDFAADALRSASRLTGERRPADVPEGYERWQLDLERRVIGTHVVTATWFLTRPEEGWSLGAGDRVAARAPVERAERILVVRRSAGLEIAFPRPADGVEPRRLDLSELPAEAVVDAQGVLEVVRLAPGRDGVEVNVRRHAGAAVLDAIAPEVALHTAVAREGILRTRVDLALVNVERQFVQAALPEGSTLIGAVVDGRPVKPLVDPRGVLLVTVPTTARTAPGTGPMTRVVLTYETRLAGPPAGRVRIPAPVFPGLEILHTTHEVGLEPDLTITAVEGDLAATGPVRPPQRSPWIARLFAAASRAESRAAATMELRNERGPAHGDGTSSAFRGPGGAAPPTTLPPPTTTPTLPLGADLPQEEAPMPEPAPAPPPAGGKAGPFEDPAAGRGEDGARSPARARRALLSLDVPVLLAPHRVVATRVGGGGVLEVAWVSDASAARGYGLAVALAAAILLLVVGLGWLSWTLAVVAGALVAAIAHFTLGASAALLVAAIVDACTAVAALGLARWTVGRLLQWRGRRDAAPPATTAPATTALGVLLALTLALGGARRASAEDAPPETPQPPAPAEPAPESPTESPTPLEVPPGSIFVPVPSTGGAGLSGDDRVFVPLATWRELQRQAHPERDPDLVEGAGVAALTEASYRVTVAEREVRGTARLVYARRGEGTRLVRVALPGLAIREARLDGEPVQLLLEEGAYLLALAGAGDHVLELDFVTRRIEDAEGSHFEFGTPTSVLARLEVAAPDFQGDLVVSGAGRVETLPPPATGGFLARAWLGRPVNAGPAQAVTARLVERRATARPAALRTRTESRVVHSVRHGGTESVLTARVHVLQGLAPFLDVALPSGVEVLEASGPAVERWETAPDRLRLVLRGPTGGIVEVRVRAFRRADGPDRREAAPELAVLETTGESGVVVVNGDPALRLEVEPGTGLFRTGRPGEPDAAGPDGSGRVLGAWRFAARPAPLALVATRNLARLDAKFRQAVTFGDDRVRTVIELRARAQRAPLGEWVLALAGEDELRAVDGPSIQAWWTEGSGAARRVVVRFADLLEGERTITLRLARRLGGVTTGLALARPSLVGAQAEGGTLVLFATNDVEPTPGAADGLKSLPPSRLEGQVSDVPGARATHAFAWEASGGAALPVALRRPEQEVEAVVVSQLAPSDEEQRLEHLVVFDVRRGATDRFALFVPDGGLAANDLVRARDLRELRTERVTRRDADGVETQGTLYDVRLQSARSGPVEVTVSQTWPASTTIRVVRPEGVKAVRWFGLVRTFLDGEVEARLGAGAADEANWADLPFLPTDLEQATVLETWAAREPYTLEVSARRHRLETQADAVVLSALAEVVVGLDGDARVRMRYRLFNRARQFLRLRLPPESVLYGAVADGRAIKPLAGEGGAVLLPVPKVPLGGTGYEVAITYRAPAGEACRSGYRAHLPLPVVEGVEVDRTAITLRVPSGYAYAFDTSMAPASEREVLGGQVEATLREAREVLEVAETGTLEQRLIACDNTEGLVEVATSQLDDLKAKGAPSQRVQELASNLERLTRLQREAQSRCELDVGVAQRSSAQFVAGAALGSNANGEVLVVVDGKESPGVGGGGGGAMATWRLNDATVTGQAQESKDLAELKSRLTAGFQGRGQADRSKSIDLDAESRKRMTQGEAGRGVASESASDEETTRFDENRNNYLLNEALRQVQSAQGQLGATTPPAPTAEASAPRDRYTVRPKLEAYERRSEGVFARGAGEATQRSGLFGVDVPLPTDGLVYRFVGVRTGSAVSWTAAATGTSGVVRVLAAVGLWAALGAGVVLVRRRFARRPT